MAGVFKQKNITSHDIIFDGALLSSTRAALVIELIKYILYERQQIPMTLDQLKRDQAQRRGSDGDVNSTPTAFIPPLPLFVLNGKEAKSMSTSHNETNEDVQLERNSLKSSDCNKSESFLSRKINPILSKVSVFKKLNQKKTQQTLADLSQLFEQIQEAFETCSEIEQVAILFGGTVVSPKESYVINFPPPCPDADCLPLNASKRALFRQVVGEDMLGTIKSSLCPTNMNLLVSAPRSIPLSWFLPKQSLKGPKAGILTALNFHCTYLVPICHELSFVDADVSLLSGIEALECSLCDQEQQDPDCDHSNNLMDITNIDPEQTSEESVLPPKVSKLKSLGVDLFNEMKTSCAESITTTATPGCTASRFCKHQKLNYIYTQRKRKQSESSPQALTVPLTNGKSRDRNSSCSIGQIHFLSPREMFDGSNGMSSKSASDQSLPENDCIWYQSPITIKGFSLKG